MNKDAASNTGKDSVAKLNFAVGIVICALLVLVYFKIKEIRDQAPEEPPEVQDFPTQISLLGQRVHSLVAPATALVKAANAKQPSNQIPPGNEQGTAIVVASDGYLLTSLHVVARAQRLTVKLHDGRELVARIIGSDDPSDLALLRIDAEGLETVRWGDSEELPIGEPVWALGHPFELANSLSFGIIGGRGRLNIGKQVTVPLLQSDAAANPGSSGGPLVNSRAEVIGVISAIVGEQYQGISFAVPAEQAQQIMSRLLKAARGQR